MDKIIQRFHSGGIHSSEASVVPLEIWSQPRKLVLGPQKGWFIPPANEGPREFTLSPQEFLVFVCGPDSAP